MYEFKKFIRKVVNEMNEKNINVKLNLPYEKIEKFRSEMLDEDYIDDYKDEDGNIF